jgi:GT2 family glycosyltransferase
MAKKFSIIIPNWNGINHLGECLDAIDSQTFRDFEVILVDNGSIDGSPEFVRNNHPSVRIVKLCENLGFAAGVNAGIRSAQGEYICLLNNDTETDQHWLENLSVAIRDYPEVWIFASKLLKYYDRGVIDSAGDDYDLWLGPYKIGENQPTEAYTERRFIFGPCGGGGCYRRELFARVGFFDEDFFAYFEDVDLSFRANWRGFRSLFVPEAVIYHKVAATSGGDSLNRERFEIMRRRNYLLLLAKNYPASFLASYLPFILLAHFCKLLLNILRGRWRVAIKTQCEIAQKLPVMMEKRRAVMAGRSISNREMRARCSQKYGSMMGFFKGKLKRVTA